MWRTVAKGVRSLLPSLPSSCLSIVSGAVSSVQASILIAGSFWFFSSFCSFSFLEPVAVPWRLQGLGNQDQVQLYCTALRPPHNNLQEKIKESAKNHIVLCVQKTATSSRIRAHRIHQPVHSSLARSLSVSLPVADCT